MTGTTPSIVPRIGSDGGRSGRSDARYARSVRALRHPAARLAPVAAAATVAALLVAGSARAARMHAFSARYAGTGSGHVSNGKASGSATIHGTGRPIGAGTLTGSATGTFTTATCVVFSGRARLAGRHGSLRLV